jgi:uncharacterized membrane protein (DUF2068 family)
MPSHPSGSRGLLFIAAFKLSKAALLLAVAIGALNLVHKDVAADLARWADLVRIDPGNVFIRHLFNRVSVLDDAHLKVLSASTFFYAGLTLTEGVGLALRRRWAEFFSIILTTSFIPIELWEIHRHATIPKLVLLVLNLAVVAYLALELRRTRSFVNSPTD